MNLLKKAVAILASAGMCLTVMTSVFAAGTVSGSDAGVSPSEPSSGGGYVDTTSPVVRPSSPIVTPSEPDKEDKPYASDTSLSGMATPTVVSPVSEPVQAVLDDQEKLAEIITEAGYVVEEDYSFVVLTAGDYSLLEPDHEGKIKLGFVIVDETVESGDKVYALHQLHNGTWEVIEATVEGVEITIELDSLSPVAIVKVMSNGDVKALAQNPVVDVEPQPEEKPAEEEKTETTVVNTEKKSPKTGE